MNANPFRVLAVDQSLVNSGWVLVRFEQSGVPELLDYGTIHTRPIAGLKGFADSFARGEHLYGAFRALLMTTEPELVLHEMPAIMGKSSSRNREAAVVACMALRCACSSLGHRYVGMVQAQHAKKVLTGLPNSPKGEVRIAVERFFDTDSMNEHCVDALGLIVASVLDGAMIRYLENSQAEMPAIGVVK